MLLGTHQENLQFVQRSVYVVARVLTEVAWIPDVLVRIIMNYVCDVSLYLSPFWSQHFVSRLELPAKFPRQSLEKQTKAKAHEGPIHKILVKSNRRHIYLETQHGAQYVVFHGDRPPLSRISWPAQRYGERAEENSQDGYAVSGYSQGTRPRTIYLGSFEETHPLDVWVQKDWIYVLSYNNDLYFLAAHDPCAELSHNIAQRLCKIKLLQNRFQVTVCNRFLVVAFMTKLCFYVLDDFHDAADLYPYEYHEISSDTGPTILDTGSDIPEHSLPFDVPLQSPAKLATLSDDEFLLVHEREVVAYSLTGKRPLQRWVKRLR